MCSPETPIIPAAKPQSPGRRVPVQLPKLRLTSNHSVQHCSRSPSMAALPQSILLHTDAEHLEALSILTLAPRRAAEAVAFIEELGENDRAHLLSLADSHHVTVRALGQFLATAGESRPESELRWAADVLAA